MHTRTQLLASSAIRPLRTVLERFDWAVFFIAVAVTGLELAFYVAGFPASSGDGDSDAWSGAFYALGVAAVAGVANLSLGAMLAAVARHAVVGWLSMSLGVLVVVCAADLLIARSLRDVPLVATVIVGSLSVTYAVAAFIRVARPAPV